MDLVVLADIQADEFVLSVDRFTPIFSVCSLIEPRLIRDYRLLHDIQDGLRVFVCDYQQCAGSTLMDNGDPDPNFAIVMEKKKDSKMMDQTILDNIIRRIVEVADPERIILFGSAARGDLNRHSDVDLLIVKEGVDTLDLMRQIRRNLYGVGAAVDAIVVTPQAIERYKDSHALIIKPALQEGKVIYESP